MNNAINRRRAILRTAQTLSVCACSSASLSLRAGPENQTSPSHRNQKLAIGIATFGFPNFSNAELARELSAAGLRVIQLFLSQSDSNFWRYNSRADVSQLTSDRCKAIADAYSKEGISIHSLGVYTNLIHPDPLERKANLAYFRAMMKVGRFMGVRTFITEVGHYQNPNGPEPHVPLHFQDSTWPQLSETLRELARIAEDYDAKVLLEPFYRGLLASAKRTRMLLEEINSPRIRALLDPANLIEVNDLEEMFQQLSPWIDCLHAKDRKLHTDVGVAAGTGSLDYPRFVALAAQKTPNAPLMLEYVGPNDYRKALAHLRNTMQAAGVSE